MLASSGQPLQRWVGLDWAPARYYLEADRGNGGATVVAAVCLENSEHFVQWQGKCAMEVILLPGTVHAVSGVLVVLAKQARSRMAREPPPSPARRAPCERRRASGELPCRTFGHAFNKFTLLHLCVAEEGVQQTSPKVVCQDKLLSVVVRELPGQGRQGCWPRPREVRVVRNLFVPLPFRWRCFHLLKSLL